ncbi:MAG: phosphoenolpyruvate synthase [Nanoarchaeota archaeon]
MRGESSDILWFKEISKDSINLVGGKGLNLGLMSAQDFPIPPGFVVTTEAYKKFLKEAGIEEKIYSALDGLDVEDSDKLYRAAEKVQNLILDAQVPAIVKYEIKEAYENLNVDLNVYKMASKQALDIIKAGREKSFVAVRSSATAEDLGEFSFAGQQATFLNVIGENEVVKSVQKCWASLFTSRAIYYRVKNNFEHRQVFIAVVVQKMVNSKKSGVVFTKNPSSGANDIVIEAGYGLGETIVSGSVTPDNYVVDFDSMKIKDKKIGNQVFKIIRDANLGRNIKSNLDENEAKEQKLDESEIIKVANICKKIEEYYRKPQDIEFAIDNKIYIVQSRPITTIRKKVETIGESKEIKEKAVEITLDYKEVLLEGLAASPHVGSGKVKIIHGADELNKIQEGDILVTEMTDPDMVPSMKRANGIITNEGGLTAHAAIVSRELGIACVVGTGKATEVLKDGQEVTVDGVNGKVYAGLVRLEEPKEESVKDIREDIDTVTKVKVNLDLPSMADKAAATNADGIGLLRSEFLLSRTKEHPAWMIKNGKKDELVNELYTGIKEIASKFKGKPIWYRTSDMRSDEYRELHGGDEEPEEDNPMMGWHGIRRSLQEPEFLKAEFEAIKKVHEDGLTNVGIMLPMVISIDEIRKSKELLIEVGLEPLENIEFGVMVESPASVQIIDDICKEGVDFISFGSNDLTQLTLCLDRNNANLSYLWDEMHPAVLREIEHVIKVCRKNNVETSICGQAGSNEKMVEFLVKKGIDSISANIDAVSKVKRKVYEIEKKLLLTVARDEFRE